MTKQEHIEFWKNQAIEDFNIAADNTKIKRHTAALFFYQLAIEKLLKAHWVKDNASNTPLFSHDLKKIYGETNLQIGIKDYDYLGVITDWNLEARYPDYKLTLQKLADKAYMQFHESKLKTLFEWLLSQL